MNATNPTISPKSGVVTFLLCVLLGIFGAHRFYVGKWGTGILMFLTGGGFGIWIIVDLVFIASNSFEDSEGRFIRLFKNPSKFKKIVSVLVGAIVSFITFVALMIALVFYLTSGMTDAIKNQLAALRAGDITKAYSYTSKDFQKATSLKDFENFVNQYPSLKNNDSSFFNKREISNNQGKVEGTLHSTDGASTPVEYRLIKEDGVWKILNLQLTPTGAGITTEQPTDSEKVAEEPSTD